MKSKKSGYKTEIDLLKKHYEGEIETLKQENKRKDLFIKIIGHDALGYLGVINNLIEFAEEGELQLEVMERNTNKGIEIIKTVKSLAQLENMSDLHLEKTDLSDIISGVIEDFKLPADEKGIKIEYLNNGNNYPIHANPLIENVLSNLISNGIKYGEDRIEVGIEDIGKEYEISVKDYGSGIPDEYKESIFERFYRIENNGDKKGVKGTGLGLYIANEVVKAHKGKIRVGDNPEGGSIFYVRLPKK